MSKIIMSFKDNLNRMKFQKYASYLLTISLICVRAQQVHAYAE